MAARHTLPLALIVFFISCQSPQPVAETPDAPSVAPSAETAPPDTTATSIAIEQPIVAGQHQPVNRSSPLFELVGVKVKIKPNKVRVMVAMRFVTRRVGHARLDLWLLDDAGRELARVTHTEPLGPETLTVPGHNLPLVRQWDATRAIWLDLPAAASHATRVRLELRPSEVLASADALEIMRGRGAGPCSAHCVAPYPRTRAHLNTE